ncbi:MAG TPA: plastocyanin/azurin family copper-binding protein [bacterium]|nr:plastocyanin/azurin family copper-binding protein [bacterium]
MTRGLAVVLIAGVMSLVAGPARTSAATTWVVQAGASANDQADQALQFLPKRITINEGDSVRWKLTAAEHTIYFPAGGKPPDLIIPGTAKGELVWNPGIFFATPKPAYDGSGPFSGGALLADPNAPKSFHVTFTKAGTYRYQCMFHPGMEGQIVVQPAGSRYPMTQAEYDKEAALQGQTALAAAKALRAVGAPVVAAAGGHQTYTLNMTGSTKDGATFYRFPVQALTIKRGDSVTWVMKDPTELHTVSFGVGKRYFDIATMRPQKQGPPTLLVTPHVMAPSGGSVHRGEGFYNSGFMLTEGPGVRSYSLTFTKAGTFEYLCAVHDDFGMRAKVIVR